MRRMNIDEVVDIYRPYINVIKKYITKISPIYEIGIGVLTDGVNWKCTPISQGTENGVRIDYNGNMYDFFDCYNIHGEIHSHTFIDEFTSQYDHLPSLWDIYVTSLSNHNICVVIGSYVNYSISIISKNAKNIIGEYVHNIPKMNKEDLFKLWTKLLQKMIINEDIIIM